MPTRWRRFCILRHLVEEGQSTRRPPIITDSAKNVSFVCCYCLCMFLSLRCCCSLCCPIGNLCFFPGRRCRRRMSFLVLAAGSKLKLQCNVELNHCAEAPLSMRDSQLCSLVDQLIAVVPMSIAGESDGVPVRFYEVIADQYALDSASIKGVCLCVCCYAFRAEWRFVLNFEYLQRRHRKWNADCSWKRVLSAVLHRRAVSLAIWVQRGASQPKSKLVSARIESSLLVRLRWLERMVL